VTLPLEIGQKFGALKVLEIIPRGAGSSRRIACLCDCGKNYEVNADRLFHGLTTKCYSCANPKWFPGIESHIRAQYVNYRGGAARRGYDYQLTMDEFREIYLSDCFYCGISPAKGIDRRDNSIGYLVENCVPCCKHCNLAKRDMSEKEFIAWIVRMAAHQGFSL